MFGRYERNTCRLSNWKGIEKLILDFTLETYVKLLHTLGYQGYAFQSFKEYFTNPTKKFIILRHDVDLLPSNSLKFAHIQAKTGIRGSYYFRIGPEGFNEKIIKEIYSLGHEVGYHYEDLGAVAKRYKPPSPRLRRSKGAMVEEELVRAAIESFKVNLEKLRKIVPVKTICMHGSPMIRWDNRLLWKYYDYHDFGITGEPYFDINFDEVLYLTDTGRRWDGGLVSLRDKAQGSELRAQGRNPFKNWKLKPVKFGHINEDSIETEYRHQNPALHTNHTAPLPKFHSTFNIIKAAERGELADKSMMTFHPQRWTDKPVPWVKELVWQNVKNVAKYFIVKVNSE